MKIIYGIYFLTAAVLCTVTADEECYNDWAKFVGNIEAMCTACIKEDNKATADCFTNASYPLDANGNLKTEEYLSYQIDEEHFTGSDETKERIKKGYRECLKDGAKTRDELHKADDCIVRVLLENCKDGIPWIEELNKSENMNICMS